MYRISLDKADLKLLLHSDKGLHIRHKYSSSPDNSDLGAVRRDFNGYNHALAVSS